MDRIVMPGRAAGVFYMYRFISRLYFYLPVLVIYFVARTHSLFSIGLLLCAYSLAVLVLEGQATRIAERVGTRHSIIGGELIKAAGLALLAGASDFGVLLLAQLMIGLGYCVATSGEALLVSRTFSHGPLHAQVQRNAHVLVLLGVVAACVAGGVVAQLYSVAHAVLISIPVPLLAALTAAFFGEPPRPAAYTDAERKPGSLARLARSPEVLVGVLSYGVSRAIFMSMFVIFIPVAYLLQYHVPLSLFGLIIGGYTVISVLVARYSAWLCRVMSERTNLLVAYLGLVLAGVLLTVQGPLPQLLYLSPVLMGFAAGMTRPLAVAQFGRLSDPVDRSRAMTLAEAVNAFVSVLLILGICRMMDAEGIKPGLTALSLMIVLLVSLTLACIYTVSRNKELRAATLNRE